MSNDFENGAVVVKIGKSGSFAMIGFFASVFIAGCPTSSTDSTASSEGAGAEWDVLNQEAVELYRRGQYNRAASVGKEALELAEQNVGPNHPDLATSLNNLA